jgi:hypothetical protein
MPNTAPVKPAKIPKKAAPIPIQTGNIKSATNSRSIVFDTMGVNVFHTAVSKTVQIHNTPHFSLKNRFSIFSGPLSVNF